MSEISQKLHQIKQRTVFPCASLGETSDDEDVFISLRACLTPKFSISQLTDADLSNILQFVDTNEKFCWQYVLNSYHVFFLLKVEKYDSGTISLDNNFRC